MIGSVIQYLFPLVVLAFWSSSDIKTGKVHNISLIIPLFLAALLNWSGFIRIFVVIFLGIFIIFMVLKGKNLFGFADVIGIPFTIMFLPFTDPIAMLSFIILFVYLIHIQNRKHYDKILKTKISSRIPLMPVLFLSYFVAVVVHLIVSLLGF